MTNDPISGDAVKYRRAIEAGALLADPEEALRLIRSVAPRDVRSGGQPLPTPSARKYRQWLAGILLRAGRSDEAARILGGDGRVDAVGPADALIIDPGSAGIGGHHYNNNAFYRRVIEGAGLSVAIVRSRGGRAVMPGDANHGVAALAMSPRGEVFEGGIGSAGLPVVNALFLQEFRRVLPSVRPRLVVTHSARHTFVEGLCRYVESVDTAGGGSMLLGIVETSAVRTGHRAHQRVKDVYRRAFAALSSVSDLRLLVVVETPEIEAFVGEVVAPGTRVLVAPYVGASYDPPDEPRVASAVPTVGFVGQSRKERGAHLIPEIARSTLAQRPNRSTWRVQLDVGRFDERFRGQANLALADLAHHSSFAVLPTRLPANDYQRLMQSIDIMVLPYALRYDSSGSGVAHECLRVGCVQVLPERSTMARSAAAAGAGFVTFAERAPEAVATAVVEALDRYEDLRGRSMEAAVGLPGEGAQRQIVDFIRTA